MLRQRVHLELPKFELEDSSQLNSVLKKLGMNDPFNEKTANFKGMGKGLCIDGVLQKTYFKVDEEGTEAAAITIIRMKLTTSIRKKKFQRIHSMIVDRPFLFLLMNDKLPINNEMLFMSKIEKL